jgi:hypothetical protein
MSEETIEEVQERLHAFTDRYGTHVQRALITGTRMVKKQRELEVFILGSVGVIPFGFMDLYNGFINAYNDHMDSITQLLEDWRYLVSDDV